jgi:hypothetical protein
MARTPGGKVTATGETREDPGPDVPAHGQAGPVADGAGFLFKTRTSGNAAILSKPWIFPQIRAENTLNGIQTSFFPGKPGIFFAMQRYTHPMKVRPDTRYPRIVTFPLISLTV